MPTKQVQERDKVASDIAGAFTDPIIVFPGGWGDTLPDWLRMAVKFERLLGERQENKTGTDAEVCAYLYTANLCGPMDSDWADIYLYVSTKELEKKGTCVPDDINVQELSQYQRMELDRLKRWIYERRIRNRQESDRAERREAKEESKKIENMPLFSWKPDISQEIAKTRVSR